MQVASESESSGIRKHRVLVVDDDPDTAEVLMILFTMIGQEPTYTLRGRDAIRLVRQVDPDIVILDIGLPDISGYEVVRALRAVDRAPAGRYIVAATGWTHDGAVWPTPGDALRARAAGFDQHLTKPFGLAQLRELVRLADAPRAPNVR